jgi:hypothetical protein
MSWSAIVHAHSRHSYDGVGEPAALVEEAIRLGAHALAITDHDDWQGSLDALEYARSRSKPLLVIPGAEVFTDQGDVLALFVDEDPGPRFALELSDAVRARGGVTVLPHPCRYRTPRPELVARVDLIETFNARTPRAANAAALALAAGKPQTVAPDAHRVAELGLARIVFEGAPPSSLDEVKARSRPHCSTRPARSRPAAARSGTSGAARRSSCRAGPTPGSRCTWRAGSSAGWSCPGSTARREGSARDLRDRRPGHGARRGPAREWDRSRLARLPRRLGRPRAAHRGRSRPPEPAFASAHDESHSREIPGRV